MYRLAINPTFCANSCSLALKITVSSVRDPYFKKKRNGGSAEFTKSAFKWKDGKLFLAKCKEHLNIVWSRFLPQDSTPSTVTIKLDPSGRWFVSILVKDPTVKPLPKTNKKVGIDVGITSLITTSNGEKVANPKQFNRLYKKLRRKQKALSRKTKGSNNRDKACLEVAKVHAQIKDARADFLHKLTTKLVRENDLIAIEDLAIRNMVRNAPPLSTADPAGFEIQQERGSAFHALNSIQGGSAVKNRKLAKSISDASWYQFTQWLNCFSKIYRIICVAVPPHFTTQDCSVCSTRVQKSLSTRTHQCPNCKTVLDRDHNAAINILKKGLKYLGEHLNGSVGHTQTDPNALGESDLWVLNGNIKDLSRLVEQGISNSDVERIPR